MRIPSFAFLVVLGAAAPVTAELASPAPDGNRAGALDGCAVRTGMEICARVIDLDRRSGAVAPSAGPGAAGRTGSVLSYPPSTAGDLGSAFPRASTIPSASGPAPAIRASRPPSAIPSPVTARHTAPDPVRVTALLLVAASVLSGVALLRRRRA